MAVLFAVVFGLVLGSFTKTSCGKPGGGFIGLSILFIIIFMIIPVIVPFIPKIIDWFKKKEVIRKIFKIKEVVNNNNNNNNNRPKNGYPTILISTIFIAVIGLTYLLINVKQFTPWIWLWMFVLGIVFLVLRWFSSSLIKLVIIISKIVTGRYYELTQDTWM
jgi:TM2 domain-containing membrane protein YozV